jgi:hypothetical protein
MHNYPARSNPSLLQRFALHFQTILLWIIVGLLGILSLVLLFTGNFQVSFGFLVLAGLVCPALPLPTTPIYMMLRVGLGFLVLMRL